MEFLIYQMPSIKMAFFTQGSPKAIIRAAIAIHGYSSQTPTGN
jgi:hypothetical protein